MHIDISNISMYNVHKYPLSFSLFIRHLMAPTPSFSLDYFQLHFVGVWASYCMP